MNDFDFRVGQEFPNVKAFRNTIKEAAIVQHFELRIIKSDLTRYYARCASENCPWKIRAVKIPNAQTFTIRSLESSHTCGKQAWRAKERGLAAIFGSSEEGYCLLPSYCDQIKRSNPKSVAQVFTYCSDNRFQRLFVSFHASIYGFLNGCLPLVSLGGIQLKSKYLGNLLVATSFDPDGGIFPIGFGVVDEENGESWMWFLSELEKALTENTENIPKLTFLSEAQKGIEDAVKSRFPGCSHAYCIRYLTESINNEFKNSRLVHLLWKAALVNTTIGFKLVMAEITEASSAAARWLDRFPPSKWAEAYFEGKRFGHLSSNIDEFNKWVLEALDLPIIQVIEQINNKLITEFHNRRILSNSWISVLTPSAEKRVIEAITQASKYQVLRSDEVEFEVISAERSDIVNIEAHTCSCQDWVLFGTPCSHAAAAILSCKKEVREFSEIFFTVGSYREVYSKDIFPIPRDFEWRKTGDGDDDVDIVRPPKIRRPPGRPEKKRVCVEEVNREKHTVRCRKCNQTGHYKTTCKGGGFE